MFLLCLFFYVLFIIINIYIINILPIFVLFLKNIVIKYFCQNKTNEVEKWENSKNHLVYQCLEFYPVAV